MPTCRKCKASFPNLFLISGKIRNLSTRKFCLQCSPFGLHNTKPDIDKSTERGQFNYQTKSYKQWSEEAKIKCRKNVFLKGYLRKKMFVEELGGCCQICGFKGSIWTMQFHHIHSKIFALSSNSLRKKPISVLRLELAKCKLLCANCHMEEHNKTKSTQKQTINGERKKQIIVDSKGGKCKLCGYNKCLRALSFHHLDPTKKEFAMDIRSCNAYPVEKLSVEADKCELLCMNCHMELEYALRKSKYLGTAGIEPAT